MIVLHVIRSERGGEAVIPKPEQVEAARKALAAEIGDLAEDSPDRKVREDRLAALEKFWERIGNLIPGDLIERREFEARPYTYGEKLRAQRECTHWTDKGEWAGFDQDEFNARMVCASLQIDRKVFDSLSPAVAEALIAEVRELSEPDPARLDFSSSSRPGCETTAR